MMATGGREQGAKGLAMNYIGKWFKYSNIQYSIFSVELDARLGACGRPFPRLSQYTVQCTRGRKEQCANVPSSLRRLHLQVLLARNSKFKAGGNKKAIW